MNFAARERPKRRPVPAHRSHEGRRSAPYAATTVARKPRAAATSVWRKAAWATSVGSKASRSAAPRPASGPGRPPRGEGGEEDDAGEEERERPARGREEPFRRNLVPVEERLRRLRGPEAERLGEAGRARPREAGRRPREELGERRVLEVRPVGPGEGVLAAGERVERLVHRGAVEPLVVDDEEPRPGARGGRLPPPRPGREDATFAAKCKTPAECGPSGRRAPTGSSSAAHFSSRSRCGFSRSRRRRRAASASSRPTATPTSAARPPSRGDFPRVPVRDAWLNHPDGGVFIWPPAFDLLVGGTARLAYGADATQAEVARVLATLPPLLGALHVVPLFFLVRRVLSRRRAVLAVAAYALLPAAAIWSQFGHGDHHVAEALLLLLLLLALARAREARAPARRVARQGRRRGSGRRRDGPDVAGSRLRRGARVPLGGPRPPAARGRRSSPSPRPASRRSGRRRTWPASTCRSRSSRSAGSSPCSSSRARPPSRSSSPSARGARPARAFAGLALLLAAATAPFALPLSSAVLRGSRYVAIHTAGVSVDEMDRGGYLSYPKDFLGVVAEARPLVRPPVAATLRTAVEELSPGFVLLPVALVLWGRRRADRRLLALFGGALFLMTLSQQRNVYYLAPFAAMALAEALARFAPRGRMRPAPVAIAAAALLVALPGLPHYGRIVGYAGAPGSDLVETLERFRALAPPPVDPAAFPQPLPGTIEGVFAPWSAGHFVTALTGYPAAADPFAYGWRRQARLFTATDDAEAERILAESRCRWLFTTDLRAVLPAYAAAAGRPGTPPDETFSVRVHEATTPNPVPFLELALDSRTAYRAPDGRVVPRFRIWRVRTATERAAGSLPASCRARSLGGTGTPAGIERASAPSLVK